jgi:hypothetical protein
MGFIITCHISYSQVVASLISLQAPVIKEKVYFFNHIYFLPEIFAEVRALSMQSHRRRLNCAPNVLELSPLRLSQRLTVHSYPSSRPNIMTLKFHAKVVSLGKYPNKIKHNYSSYVPHEVKR